MPAYLYVFVVVNLLLKFQFSFGRVTCKLPTPSPTKKILTFPFKLFMQVVLFYGHVLCKLDGVLKLQLPQSNIFLQFTTEVLLDSGL